MRRDHQTIKDLVQARVTDFVEGNASESVLRASLKALRLSPGEIDHEVELATMEWIKRAKKSPVDTSLEASSDWMDTYLKR